MPCVVQVCDDYGSNFVYLISEVSGGKSSAPAAFVQTADGVESISTGARRLQGAFRHRFSGSFAGGKEAYISAIHSGGVPNFSSWRMLERAGVTDLKRGSGVAINAQGLVKMLRSAKDSKVGEAAIGVAVAGATVLTMAQVGFLWQQFSADGVLSQAEVVRMGLELSEIGNPVKAIAEVGKAFVTHEGILDVAAEPGLMDGAVNGLLGGEGQGLDGAGVGTDYGGEGFDAAYVDPSGGLADPTACFAGPTAGFIADPTGDAGGDLIDGVLEILGSLFC